MTHGPSLEVAKLVTSIAEQLRNARQPSSPADAVSLAQRICDQVIAHERERCVSLCRERAALWRDTLSARSDIAAAREEARARANEAAYLADLLEAPPAERHDDPDDEATN